MASDNDDCQGSAVFVVEDDEDVRESLRVILESEGYCVATAENGRDALTQLEGTSLRPCLILLDLMMPVMNGWEFLDRVQGDSHLASIPVVVVSAVADRAPQNIVRRLPKPIAIDDLLRVTREHCAGLT